MIIRKALPGESRCVACLTAEALGNLSENFTCRIGREDSVAELEKLFLVPGNRFSREYCITASAGEQVLGAITSYPAAFMPELNRNLLREISGSPVLPAEASADEYYIDSLAVSENFRNRGLGRLLLEAAEKRAVSAGWEKISLLAAEDNPAAASLYKKCGYRENGGLELFGCAFLHMVKPLY